MEEIVTRLRWQVSVKAEAQWRGNRGSVCSPERPQFSLCVYPEQGKDQNEWSNNHNNDLWIL